MERFQDSPWWGVEGQGGSAASPASEVSFPYLLLFQVFLQVPAPLNSHTLYL